MLYKHPVANHLNQLPRKNIKFKNPPRRDPNGVVSPITFSRMLGPIEILCCCPVTLLMCKLSMRLPRSGRASTTFNFCMCTTACWCCLISAAPPPLPPTLAGELCLGEMPRSRYMTWMYLSRLRRIDPPRTSNLGEDGGGGVGAVLRCSRGEEPSSENRGELRSFGWLRPLTQL